jgi:hypothetical protein
MIFSLKPSVENVRAKYQETLAHPKTMRGFRQSQVARSRQSQMSVEKDDTEPPTGHDSSTVKTGGEHMYHFQCSSSLL